MQEHMSRRSAFKSLVDKYQTEDGLIQCSAVKVRTWVDGYDLVFIENPDVELFPVPETGSVVDILASRPDLWNQASVRLTYHPSILGSAPIFGVPFRRAVEIARKSGYTKSKYYLPDNFLDGNYKSLLLYLRTVDDIRGSLIQLEAWQYTPGTDYAHYLHALSPDFESEIVHLDGATIQYTGLDLEVLLLSNKKVKGTNYRKYFRLDGNLSTEDMHLLAGAFLPGEHLYNEALGVTSYDA